MKDLSKNVSQCQKTQVVEPFSRNKKKQKRHMCDIMPTRVDPLTSILAVLARS